MSTDNQHDSNDIEKISAQIEEFLSHILLLGPNKPWYISTTEIYKLVKQAAAAIPQSNLLFNKCLDTINLVTKYLQENTNVKISFEVTKSHEWIDSLDRVLSELLVKADDHFDDLRAHLSMAIRKLIVALIQHKEWAKSKSSSVSVDVTSRYEQALKVLQSLLESFHNKYPDIYDKTSNIYKDSVQVITTQSNIVVDYVNVTKNFVFSYLTETFSDAKSKISDAQTKVDSTIFATTVYLLKTAQPYVHEAVQRSQPYITHAVEVSQPYVIQAKPYIDPIFTKAVDVNHMLQENKTIGPYVVKAYDTASVVLSEAKAYCISPEEAIVESK